MKTLLAQILAGQDLQVGNWSVYVWSDGSAIVCRQHRSGLMGRDDYPTVAGLKRVLDWIDAH